MTPVAFLCGMALSAFLFWIFFCLKKNHFQQLGETILHQATLEAERKKSALLLELKEREFAQARLIATQQEEERKRREREEEKSDAKMQLITKKIGEIEKKEESVQAKKNELEAKLKELSQERVQVASALEKIGGMTQEQAREMLLKTVEGEMTLECAKIAEKRVFEMQENVERESARLLTCSLSRLALPAVHALAVTTVPLPSEEMKGRIIGREGRNIRLLEQLTGVNYIIDEAPASVSLSCFDPARREIAKIALQELIQDGRIHPTRIEEVVARAHTTLERQCKERGEAATLKMNVRGVHPEIVLTLGRLSLRYSYGQNVLEHSIEVAHLMGLMALELKLDAPLARRIGLLHDLGKALSQDIMSTHAIAGHDFALRYGESVACANGIGCHHHEMPPATLEASLCPFADHLSGSRLGARAEAAEQTIKRLTKLEAIAMSYPGVERAYALGSGNEIRVIVEPEMVDDRELVHLGRVVAKRIEEEVTYPGKIKITLIREKKAIEYAT